MSTPELEILREKAKLVTRSVWQRRWLVVAVATLVALALCSFVSFLPNRYQASARIYVDTQSVLKPLMVGLAYQPDIEQQVRMLARTLISRPNVEKIVELQDLGLNEGGSLDRDEIVTSLMEKIKFEGGGAGNLYVVTYRDSNPERARRVVEAIVDLFMIATSGNKRSDSQDASRFIGEQIKEYEAKLVAAENRVKDFKVRNFGITGVQSQDYFSRMSSLSDQVSKLRVDYAAAEKARNAYRRELAAEDPQLPVEGGPAPLPAVPSESDNRLEAQRKLLDELLRRYTEAHPDVVAARRVITQLESQKRSEIEQKPGSLPVRRGMAATSPVYQRIRVALAEAEAQVASLGSQLAAQQGELERTRAVASRVPQVESELAQLNRDYDVIRKNYEVMVARRESASLGIKLDESSQLTEYRVVEPPRVAPRPVFPSRAHLGVVTILASLLAGVLVAVGIELLRPTFHDLKSLRQISNRPVLGPVSLVGAQVKQSRFAVMRFAGALTVLLALQVGWLGWIIARPPS